MTGLLDYQEAQALRDLLRRAHEGPSEATLAAAPAALLDRCARPQVVELLYPWGSRRLLRPRMVRGLIRAALDRGELATDAPRPADASPLWAPPDWAWVWRPDTASGPGAPPDQAILDRLTPPTAPVEWTMAHADPEPDQEGDAPEEAPRGRAPGTGTRDERSEGVDLHQIARELGVSHQRVSQIEAEALAKIRRLAPWLLDHLTGATTRPKIKAPPREKDPQPMAKDLPDDDKPTDTPTPYGALRSRVLAALCRHPEGVVVKALAPEVGTHQSTVRSTLQRALREGTAARQGQLWLPTATTATAPPSVRPRPPIPQPGQRHREGKLLILDALAARGGQRHGELLAETGLPPATLSREMRRLIEAGRVVKAGQTYSLATAPAAVAAPPAPAPAPKAPPPRPAAPVAVAVAPTGRLAAARAAVAALSPEELDALLASLAPVVEARRALDAALAGLRA